MNTTAVALSLLDTSYDPSVEEWFCPLPIKQSDEGLVCLSFDNPGKKSIQIDTYSIIGYLLLFIFYRCTGENDDLFTSMLSLVQKDPRHQKILNFSPVISVFLLRIVHLQVPSLLSLRHIELLRESMHCYELPESSFVESSIAFGLAYGYFRCSNMGSAQKEVAVVINCGDAFLTTSVIEFRHNEMHMCFCVTVEFGGRLFSKDLFNLIIDKSNSQNRLTKLSHYRLQQEMSKWKNQINIKQIDSTLVAIDSAFGNEADDDLYVKVTYSEFLSQVSDHMKVFDKALQPLREVGMILSSY